MGALHNLYKPGFTLVVGGETVGTFDSISPVDPAAEYVEGPGEVTFTRKFQRGLVDGDMEAVGVAAWLECLPEESWTTIVTSPKRITMRSQGAPTDVMLLAQAQLDAWGIEPDGTYSPDCVAKVVAFLGSLGFYPDDGLEGVDPELLERYSLEMARAARGGDE